MEVPRVEYGDFASGPSGEPSAAVRERQSERLASAGRLTNAEWGRSRCAALHS